MSLFTFTNLYCKLVYSFGTILSFNCSYAKVIVSVDRLISIKYSKKFMFTNTIKFQLYSLLIGFCISVTLAVPAFLFNGNILSPYDNRTSYCSVINETAGFYISFGSMLLFTILPVVIMVTSTLYQKLKEKYQQKPVEISN